MNSLTVVEIDTAPVSWKVFDAGTFVAHFTQHSDAEAFARLANAARFDSANWMDWTVTVKDSPSAEDAA